MGNIIQFLSQRNHFSAYLAIFRVFISVHIIKKIFVNWGSLSVMINNASIQETWTWVRFPYLYQSFLQIPVFVLIIYTLCILWILGIGKHLTVLALFFAYMLFSAIFSELANGGDNLLYFVLFYMVFTDSYQYLSLRKTKPHNNNTINNLAVLSIMIHLCLVYFVSAFHKIHADEWFNGVATYYIWNIERFKSPLNDYFSRNGFIIASSTYFTLLFELFFPVLIWFRQTRNLMIATGIVLHLGIYLTMMIYDFELLFISLYGFWVPDAFWKKLIQKLNTKTNSKWAY